MKGIILVAVTGAFCSFFILLLLAWAKPARVFRAILGVYAAGNVLFPLAYAVTPENLGFLPTSFLEPYPVSDVLNGFLLLHLFFWLFVFQGYSLASRGFSLGLIIAIQEGGDGGLSFSEIQRRFGGGKSVEGNFEDKLLDSVQSGLVRRDNVRYFNTPRGERLAALTESCKRFFKTGPGG